LRKRQKINGVACHVTPVGVDQMTHCQITKVELFHFHLTHFTSNRKRTTKITSLPLALGQTLYKRHSVFILLT